MKKSGITCDVFLSASPLDSWIAEVVQGAFEARGLRVFVATQQVIAEPGVEESIRSALAESHAFVAILSRSSIRSDAIAVEIGAAWAWGKGIYLLLDGLDRTELPGWLVKYPAEPAARVHRIIREILGDVESRALTSDQVQLLGERYRSEGVSIDQLFERPAALESLTRRFNREGGTDFPPERILQELLRLGKQGQLRKFRRTIS